MAVNGNDACYVFALFFFFGILVPSMQHSCHVLHAFCFYFWTSPGTVACLLFALHVCHASTVTAAFRYPLCFFLGWLHTRMVPVMSLLVFFWHISSVPAAFWVNGLGLGLGLWSGLRLRLMVNGLGLRLGLWSGLRLRLRLMVNGLGLGLGLWSGLRLRLMVNGLGLGLGLRSGLGLRLRLMVNGLGLGLGLLSGLRLRFMVMGLG